MRVCCVHGPRDTVPIEGFEHPKACSPSGVSRWLKSKNYRVFSRSRSLLIRWIVFLFSFQRSIVLIVPSCK